MDLAKIRQKAHQQQSGILSTTPIPLSGIESMVAVPPTSPPAAVSRPMERALEAVGAAEMAALLPGLSPIIAHDLHPAPSPIAMVPQVPVSCAAARVHSSQPVRDPLATILAGRAAAGCDEDLPMGVEETEQATVADYLEFLCFRVSDELYGINIMDIKEIIKPREATEIPRSPSFVLGVISLRGIIIPIIDMLDRLGLSRERLTGRERIVVVKRLAGLSGLLVDEIVQVVRIPAKSLETAPAVLDGIDRDFVSNIGRAEGKMIIILNLECIADINLY